MIRSTQAGVRNTNLRGPARVVLQAAGLNLVAVGLNKTMLPARVSLWSRDVEGS